MSGDSASLSQDLNVYLDVLPESYFDYVIDVLRSETADALHQAAIIQEDRVGACSARQSASA